MTTRVLSALLVLALPAASQTAGRAARVLWEGKSGPYKIEWSAGNLRVTRAANGKAVLDAAEDAKVAWTKLSRLAKGEAIEADYSYRLLSVAAPYLSIEKTESCDCGGAHPTAVTRFQAIRLDRSAPNLWVSASLTDLFPEAAVLAALVNDPAVKKALPSAEKPESLAAFIAKLHDETVKVKDCEYEFPTDLLKGFAFYAVHDATVQVRIGLPSAEEACRGQITQLGLTLPAPEAAKVMFAKQGESLLMIDSHRMPASAVTSFHFVQKKR